MKKVLSCLILSAFLMMTATAGNAQQQKANMNGIWKMNVETTAGSGTPVFELKHVTDISLTGTYTGRLGEAIVKGTLQDNVIHLEFSINGTLIEYDGTVEGDTMKGKVKLGSMAKGTFTGARKKS